MSGFFASPNHINGTLTVAGGDIVLDNNKALKSKLVAGDEVQLLKINGIDGISIGQSATPGPAAFRVFMPAGTSIKQRVGATDLVTVDAAGLTMGADAHPALAAADAFKQAVRAAASVTFGGGAPGLNESFNVSSVSDNGTGITYVNFSSNMSGTYLAIPSVMSPGDYHAVVTLQTAALCEVTVYDNTGTPVDVAFSLIVFGTPA